MFKWTQTKLTWLLSNYCSGVTNANQSDIYVTCCKCGLFRYNEQQQNSQLFHVVRGYNLRGLVWNRSDILYICDYSLHQIMKYNINTGTFTTFCGSQQGYKDGNFSEAEFCFPTGITIDKKGDLYITEDHKIRKINMESQLVETIAGCYTVRHGHKDGYAKEAMFRDPHGIAISDDGTIYVCDTGNHCIRTIKDGIVYTIGIPRKQAFYSVDGPWDSAKFDQPTCLVLKRNILYVLEFRRLRKVDLTQNLVLTENDIQFPHPINCFSCDGEAFYFGCKDSLWKLLNQWCVERVLWIGHLKESSLSCSLALIPRDMIQEIISHLRKMIIRNLKTQQ